MCGNFRGIAVMYTAGVVCGLLFCCVDWNWMLYKQKDRHRAMSVKCPVLRHYSNEYFAFFISDDFYIPSRFWFWLWFPDGDVGYVFVAVLVHSTGDNPVAEFGVCVVHTLVAFQWCAVCARLCLCLHMIDRISLQISTWIEGLRDENSLAVPSWSSTLTWFLAVPCM